MRALETSPLLAILLATRSAAEAARDPEAQATPAERLLKTVRAWRQLRRNASPHRRKTPTGGQRVTRRLLHRPARPLLAPSAVRRTAHNRAGSQGLRPGAAHIRRIDYVWRGAHTKNQLWRDGRRATHVRGCWQTHRHIAAREKASGRLGAASLFFCFSRFVRSARNVKDGGSCERGLARPKACVPTTCHVGPWRRHKSAQRSRAPSRPKLDGATRAWPCASSSSSPSSPQTHHTNSSHTSYEQANSPQSSLQVRRHGPG